MKNFNRAYLFNSLVTIGLMSGALFLNSCNPDKPEQNSFMAIESGFRNIPDSVQTSIYWYWISDNISKEGVVKDLRAMKKVGINRAFIGNIGLEDTPYGDVKIFSDVWWEIVHTALKTATELNIEIGIFNSPGWSQSGGPWVKPEQSMRYLASTELVVTGPQKLNRKMDSPAPDFQPVNVIAWKVPAPGGESVHALNPQVTAEPGTSNARLLFDGHMKTEVALIPGKNLNVTLKTGKPATVRSLVIRTAEKPTKANGELQVREEGQYKTLASFEINRSNPNLVVGFHPYAPVVIAVPATTATEFRLQVTGATAGSALAEVELSPEVLLERYPEKSLAKMFQTPLPYWHDYLWAVQPEPEEAGLVVQPEEVKDITASLDANGMLTWEVPEGNWKIMYNGMVPTGVVNEPASPEATGLEADKMSKPHIAAHFDAYLGEIMRRVPAEDRKTWKVVVEDSYERGGQNWTDGFAQEFQKTYGYDPTPYIPALNGQVVGSRDRSDRFLWDLRRLVADKIAYDYVGGLREISNKNGLKTWLENYGHWGFPGEFLQYGGQSDEIGGEFWSEGELGDIENRAASSCGHIYGKRKISAESFTCAGNAYSRHPANMKQRGDRFFTEGINNTLLHVYISQPDERRPGLNAWFGNEFNRHNTWFSYLDLFTQYLKRCNLMLQQGTYVADVAYFIGEDVPKMTGVCDPPLPKGYSFDYINAEVLHQRASVKNGRIVLPDGMSYRILILPKLETMRPELLNRLKDMVEQGAVVLGPAPKRSPSLEGYPGADNQVQTTAAQLWGNVDGVKVKSAKVGQGMILNGMDMKEALDMLGIVPDFRVNENDPVLFIHRTLADGELYFITNQSDKAITVSPEFRVTGKSPEWWDATSGEVRELPAFKQTVKTTVIPLKLAAFGSQFIIFRKKAGPSAGEDVSINFPEGKLLAELNQPWTVSFSPEERGPEQPVTFATLSDWTLSENENIKYYSGTAIYRTRVELPDVPEGKKIVLDLGNLTSMAKVSVNGKEAGGVWTAPWQIDISEEVVMGKNELEIYVVNNWMNRLIGDLKLPAEQRQTWTPILPYEADTPLQPSGLFGPVSIRLIE